MLLHVPEVLTAREVADFRAQLGAADWTDGTATVGTLGAAVKRNRQLPEHSPIGQALGTVVLAALARQPLFVSAALPLRTVPPLFNRYEGGAHYGAHIDGAVRPAPGAGFLRTDLSCTLFLSEPEAYDGGELVVQDSYGTHEVKLPAGDLVLYPAGSLHHVEPVTRGTRLASFFWVQSMVRQDARRTLLFELDQNLQSLRGQFGDTPEIVALAGLYHNLLREWVEV